MDQELKQAQPKPKEPKIPYSPSLFRMGVFLPFMLMVLVGLIWGVAHWQEFRQNPMDVLLVYVQNPFRVFYLVMLWVEGITAYLASPLFRRSGDEIMGDWVHWQNHWWETVLVISVFSDSRGYWIWGENGSIRWIGCVLLVLALGVEWMARSTRRKVDRLNPDADFPREGIYAHVRFPEYLELMLQSFGIALLFNSWPGLFAAVLSIGFLLGRIFAHDRRMLQKYGVDWSDYQHQVKRLIPYLW